MGIPFFLATVTLRKVMEIWGFLYACSIQISKCPMTAMFNPLF